MLRYGLAMMLLIHPAWVDYWYISGLPALLLVIGYVCLYRSEKKYSNKYYVSMLSVWGIVAIAVPVCAAIVDILGGVILQENTNMYNHSIIFYISNFSGILLFSIFLIICAYLMDRKYFIGLAVAVLFAYMLLAACFGDKSIPFPFMPGQPQAGIPYHSVYYNVVTWFGYFVLGLYIRYRERRESGL